MKDNGKFNYDVINSGRDCSDGLRFRVKGRLDILTNYLITL